MSPLPAAPAPPLLRRPRTARSVVPPPPTGRPDAALVIASAAGLVAGLLVVGSGAGFQSRVERDLLGSWLGTATSAWTALGGRFQDRRSFLAALALLVLAWCVSGWRVMRPGIDMRPRLTALLLLAPALPFVVAPPFMSKDAYAYVAQGKLLLVGGDPYQQGVRALGRSVTVAAVDPLWRSTTSPYGPVALRLQEAVVWASGGREVVALALLRVVVVLCALGSLVAVRRLAPPERRARATWLACSPLMLVHVIAPAHLEAVISVLLLSSLVLYASRRLAWAGGLAVCAAEVKVTALIALICLVVHAAKTLGRRAVRPLLTGATVAGLGCALLMPSDPVGWIRGLSTPGSGWAPFAPANAAISILDEALDLASVRSVGWLLPATRLTFALAGCLVLLRLLRRSPGRPATTAGLASLAASAAAPVLWPWYLTPGTLLLAPSRSWVLPATVGATGAFLALPLRTSFAERVGTAAIATGVLIAFCVRHRSLKKR